MSTRKVRMTRDGSTFPSVLSRAMPGDVILLPEGHHGIEQFWVRDITLRGVGDPTRVVVVGQIDLEGHLTLENLTVVAPPRHNALRAMHTGDVLQATGVHIHPEPLGKYPAVYVEHALVTLERCHVRQKEPTDVSVTVVSGGDLRAETSSIGLLELNASKAYLRDTACCGIASETSTVVAAGSTSFAPVEGRRSIVAYGESHVQVQHAVFSQAEPQAFIADSLLRVDGYSGPEGSRLLVFAEGHHRLDSTLPQVQLTSQHETGAETATTEPRAPELVLWRAGTPFADVAPRLAPGDTLVMEEGTYDLPSDCDFVTLGVDVLGKGDLHTIVLRFGIVVGDGADITLSNVTIRPIRAVSAITVGAGKGARLERVLVDHTPHNGEATVHVPAGTLVMSNCTVVGDEARSTGVIQVDDDAAAEFTGCSLGWVVAYGAVVRVTDCEAYGLEALDGAQATVRGTLTVAPCADDRYSLISANDSRLTIEHVSTDHLFMGVLVNSSSLRLGSLSTSQQAQTQVVLDGEVDVVVDADVTYLRDGTVVARPGQPGATEPEPDATRPEDDGAGSAVALEDPIAQIEGLIGLRRVKEQVREFVQFVQFNEFRRSQGFPASPTTLHSMFLGSPGTGKTTVARLLGTALHQAGAVRTDTFVEVGRGDIVGQSIGASARLMTDVLDSARGGVLFIDEAYSLYQANNNEFAQEAVDTLIAYMENHRDDIVVIVAGYTDKMQDFLRMNPGLASRVPNRFDFEDYAPDEVARIGLASLSRQQYVVDEDAYVGALSRAYRTTAERSNGRWVRNVNDELLRIVARRVMSTPKDDPARRDPGFAARITQQDLDTLTGGDARAKAESVEALLDELNALVGLHPVKEWVHNLIDEVRAARLLGDANAETPTCHMVFSGNPGTGKTTVARIIAQLFHNLDILARPTVKTVERSALVGQWVGHTEKRTADAIDEAMGGVIFVDEAYQLTMGGSHNDFGQVAVETFMTRLENDRDRFVAIFAGYTAEMESFLAANPGLRSRVPLSIEFPDYSPEEIGQIVTSRLSRQWRFDHALAASVAAAAYDELPPERRANARWARTFSEDIERRHKRAIVAAGISGDAAREISDETIRGSATPSRSDREV